MAHPTLGDKVTICGVKAPHVESRQSSLNKRLLDLDDFARGVGYEKAYGSLGDPAKTKFRHELRGEADIISCTSHRECLGNIGDN